MNGGSLPIGTDGPVGGPLERIASGNARHCFAHPWDRSLCIKVAYTATGARASEREARYFERVERRYGAEAFATHAARHRGRVATSAGPGHVWERVCHAPGAAAGPSPFAPVLLEAFDERAYAAAPEAWERAFEAFARWTRATPLAVRDLTPVNLCVRRLAGEALELVAVDGLLPSSALARWWPTRAQARRRNPVYAARRGMADARAALDTCAALRERRIAAGGLDRPPGGDGESPEVRLLGPGGP